MIELTDLVSNPDALLFALVVLLGLGLKMWVKSFCKNLSIIQNSRALLGDSFN